MQEFLRSRGSVWRPSAIRKILAAVSSCVHASVLVLPRYFVNFLDSMKSMNPAEVMSKRSWLLDLDDRPETTKRTKFCLAQPPFPILGQMWLLTAGRLTNVTVLCAELTWRQECLRATAQSRRDEDRAHIHMCLVVRLHFSFFFRQKGAFTTVMEFLDLRRVSFSPELESFLLSMCTDAADSITNSHSSDFSEEGPGITQASAAE